MAEKAVSKEYLLKQLRLLIGKELYEEITDTKVITPASCVVHKTGLEVTEYTFYKYTGLYNAIEVTTQAEADAYTVSTGETIVIGDKVRPSYLVTDDNILDYADTVAGVEVDNLLKLSDVTVSDCPIADGDATASTYINYLNTVFFEQRPIASGCPIDLVTEVTEDTTDPFKSILKDIREKKARLIDCTRTQYYKLVQANAVEHNVMYYITDAIEPTCWLNFQNVFGGSDGGIDTSTAKDGDFLVYSADVMKPVWKEVKDTEGMLF